MRKFLWFAAAAALTVSPVDAQLKVSTGVAADGAPLADYALDPFWSISLDGGTTFASARTVGPDGLCCVMGSADETAARWIADPSIAPGSGATGWELGETVIARRSFTLGTSSFGGWALEGIWRTADYPEGIFLNGSLVHPSTFVDPGLVNTSVFPWAVDQPLSVDVSSLLVTGENVLELRGRTLNRTTDGFYLDAVIVPEPPVTMLLIPGLVAFALVGIRRRDRGSEAA